MFFNVESQPDCETCGLRKVCTTPKLRVEGDGGLGVLIISDNPDTQADNAGTLKQSRNYIFLKQVLDSMGIKLEQDCWYTTVVACRTPRNRTPTTVEVKSCLPRLQGIIDRLNPRVVILLGDTPFNALIQPKLKGRLLGHRAEDFAGDTIPDGRWLCPTWGFKYLMSTRTYEDDTVSKPFYQRDTALFKVWRHHLFNAISLYNKPLPVLDHMSMIKVTQDIDQAMDWMEEALDWDYIAFDYETTGVKPHRKGHRIICTSISNGEISYAFPMFEDTSFLRMWNKLLTSNIKKIAHNMAFEGLWTKVLLGYWMKNWYWDTMIAQHCIHNQKKTGLKYLTYAHFGVIGYDNKADPYIKSIPAEKDLYGDNAFNLIASVYDTASKDALSMQDLLVYNALDSLFTALIYEKQTMSKFQMEGFEFFMETTEYLTKTQANGFRLNVDKYNVIEKELQNKIDGISQEIMSSSEVAQWNKVDKSGTPVPFNFNSTKHLQKLLFDILGEKPVKKTPSGEPSVDVEALQKMESPLVTKILEYRKYAKLLNTYIHQYSVEAVDGMIHPFYQINGVNTFRSSCSSVNVQNLPKRDKEAKSMITSLVLPRKGHKLIGYDFKSLEVMINACHSGDKNLLAYASDPSKDMHRDSSKDIFMLDEVPKGVRGGIKGAFVFSSFYGSYYKQTAPDCWELAQQEGLLPHLASKGITTFDQFEERVKHAEYVMWNERFKVHDKWRKQQWKDYLNNGYIESYTGFRMQAPMSRNNSFNCAVQGDSYHIMQWAYNQVYREIEERGMDVQPWAEIHDSGQYSCNPADEAYLDYLVWKYYVVEVKNRWKWINVNLQVEKEAGEVDGDWSSLKTIGFLGENGNIEGA